MQTPSIKPISSVKKSPPPLQYTPDAETLREAGPLPERLPESRGDLADQAQEDIDFALEEKIRSIRRQNRL